MTDREKTIEQLREIIRLCERELKNLGAGQDE